MQKFNCFPVQVCCAGIYIHIPFCVRKCAYCDFLSFPASEEVQKQYGQVLIKEVRSVCQKMADKKEGISTVYFGGGTPSLVSADLIERILAVIAESCLLMENAEITLEMNPGTASIEKMKRYRQAGVNRLSIGMQSFQEEELKLLGRIHTPQMAEDAFSMAREAGFSNISLDLMSGLPGQTMEGWKKNLEKAISLSPEHISAYSLIIEEGTPFYERYGEDWSEEHEELDRQIYEETKAVLGKAGYCRYEISNYAKPGFESRHNSSYWMGIPYYGCGLGAASLVCEGENWIRRSNIRDLAEYLKADQTPEEEEILSREARMEEFMFLGLRMTKGVCTEDFEKRFAESFDEIYGKAAEKLLREGLLEQDGNVLRLTDRGLNLCNYCFEQFLFD